MKKLHTDDLYRGRWQEYHLADGRVFDSRQVHWRQIDDFDKVVAIKTVIRDKTYLTHCKNPGFKFFLTFRWGGQTFVNGERKKIHDWAVGWSDGEKAYMTDINFKTGRLVRQYVVPIEQVQRHIHPKVSNGGRYAVIASIQ